MPKKISLKYFSNKLRKLRLIISQLDGYKSVDELFAMQNKDTKSLNFIQPQGRNK